MTVLRSAVRVSVAGVSFDRLTQAELVEQVAAAIAAGAGGTIVTPNIDICHQLGRDPASRALVAGASLVVADGMPLLWAARLAGTPLPERIAGADLIYSLSAAAQANGWPVYLAGGLPGTGGEPSAARLAGDRLAERYPGLVVTGAWAPQVRFDPVTGDISALTAELAEARPALVFVGLGFPKQELLIERLRTAMPQAWFVGCGAAIPYAAGRLRRAPLWMQRSGMEWLYRLLSEPRRLASRYLGRDLPYALALLLRAAWTRLRAR